MTQLSFEFETAEDIELELQRQVHEEYLAQLDIDMQRLAHKEIMNRTFGKFGPIKNVTIEILKERFKALSFDDVNMELSVAHHEQKHRRY
jgi:hypothetical protein